MHKLDYRHFIIGTILSLAIAVVFLGFSFGLGKNEFFLWLNTDLGKAADYFFAAWTYTGDGLIWIAVLAVLVWLKRTDALPLTIASFTWSTLFTQVCKYIIVPDEPRPIKAIADTSQIHTVPGVELHLISSFPSGHTTTAFTLYLLFCLVLPARWWLGAGLLYALLVGYSRVYLAQHFPLDVAAGMITAVVSVALSVPVQNWWAKRAQKTTHSAQQAG